MQWTQLCLLLDLKVVSNVSDNELIHELCHLIISSKFSFTFDCSVFAAVLVLLLSLYMGNMASNFGMLPPSWTREVKCVLFCNRGSSKGCFGGTVCFSDLMRIKGQMFDVCCPVFKHLHNLIHNRIGQCRIGTIMRCGSTSKSPTALTPWLFRTLFILNRWLLNSFKHVVREAFVRTSCWWIWSQLKSAAFLRHMTQWAPDELFIPIAIAKKARSPT